MPLNLEPLLQFLPGWTLVLFRITGIFITAPLFGSTAIPARIKVLLAVGLSFCIYPVLYPTLHAPGSASAAFLARLSGSGLALPALAAAVAAELLIGLVIGYGATLPLNGIQMAGHIVDQQIGLGMAGIFNPDLDTESSVMAQFYYFLAVSIFIVLGGHRLLLSTLLDSFQSVPLGGFHADSQLLALVLGLLRSMFELALRVAAPLLCLVFLETVATGFIARTVPQMNILSVGFPLRILIGIGILIVSLNVESGVFVESMRNSLKALHAVFSSS
jgi:flagellar biosynthesis protein FliR